MIWMFEKDAFFEGNVKKMAEIARSKGHDVYCVNYTSMGNSIHGMPEYEQFLFFKCIEEPVVLYGSLNFINFIKNTYRWSPIAWLDRQKLTFQYLYSHIGRYCLNHEYIMLPLRDADRIKMFLFSALNKDFIKGQAHDILIFPDYHGDFPAQRISDMDHFKKWYDEIITGIKKNEAPMAVMTPVWDISEKWRVIISDGRIITASKYYSYNNFVCYEDMNAEMIDYVEHIIRHTDFNPYPMLCMDICRLSTGVLRVMKIDSINTAKFFACDLEKILDNIESHAIIEHNNWLKTNSFTLKGI